MSRLTWSDESTRDYYSGVDRGVYYPDYGPGVNWDGLVSVAEAANSIDSGPYFVDGVKYANASKEDSFSATVVAYTFPEELDSYINTGYGFCYRSLNLNEQNPSYKLHIVYDVRVIFTELPHTTISDTISPDMFTMTMTTTPSVLRGFKPSSHFIIDTSKTHPWVLEELEKVLYGTDGQDPRLPTTEELRDIFEDGSILTITDHGDGTWTADGPSDVIQMIDDTTFSITAGSVIFLDLTTFQVSSM